MGDNLHKEKNKQFIILQAIAIILVLIGHKGAGFETFNNWFYIYSYHMAIFIFISGYFFSIKNILNLKSYIWKKVKSLIIPYYIYNLIYGIIVTILRKNGIVDFGNDLSLKSFFIDGWIDGQPYMLNLATWFVLSLFLIQISFSFIRLLCEKIKFNNEYLILATLLIFGISTIAITNSEITISPYFLPILRVLFLLPFFQFGYIYKNKLEKIDNINSIFYFGILFIAIQLVKLYAGNNFYDYYCVEMEFKSFYILAYITSFIGILFFYDSPKYLQSLLEI